MPQRPRPAGLFRRMWPLLIVVAIVLSTIVPALGPGLTSVSAASARTLDNVNLRNGAGTGFAVILVIPRNTLIDVTGSLKNGFYPATYKGKSGWVASQFVTFGAGGAETTATATPSTIRYTTDNANLRGGASTSSRVITVVPRGSAVTVTGPVDSTFYPVSWNTQSGWISETLLSATPPTAGTTTATATRTATRTATPSATATATAAPGSTSFTTARVNLRASASASGRILTVVPANTQVALSGQVSNNYAQATYLTFSGWISRDYLSATGATATPTSTPAVTATPSATPVVTATPTFVTTPSATGTAWAKDNVNLRTGPGTSWSKIVIVPLGAQITLLGQTANGFVQITWSTYTGWISGTYVTSTQPVIPTPPTGGPTYTRDEIIAIIYAAADAYGQSRVDMLRVATCESNLDPYNVTPPYSASGLFQFLPGTWATTPYKDQSIFDPVANANAAAWMWSVGRRNEWVCK